MAKSEDVIKKIKNGFIVIGKNFKKSWEFVKNTVYEWQEQNNIVRLGDTFESNLIVLPTRMIGSLLTPSENEAKKQSSAPKGGVGTAMAYAGIAIGVPLVIIGYYVWVAVVYFVLVLPRRVASFYVVIFNKRRINKPKRYTYLYFFGLFLCAFFLAWAIKTSFIWIDYNILYEYAKWFDDIISDMIYKYNYPIVWFMAWDYPVIIRILDIVCFACAVYYIYKKQQKANMKIFHPEEYAKKVAFWKEKVKKAKEKDEKTSLKLYSLLNDGKEPDEEERTEEHNKGA